MNSITYDDIVSNPENEAKNRYTLADKVATITMLEGESRVRNGEMTPRYTNVSQFLEIPASTLRKWYAKKDQIRKLAEERGAVFSPFIAQKLQEHSVMIIAEIERRGISSFSNAQLVNYLGKSLMFERLLSGKSTKNVANTHAFYTPLPPVQK